MATTLPVNFKDDILDASMNGKRRYQLISNSDGTYSLEDVTEYTQEGSNFGAAQINATNTAVNESVKDMGSYSGDLNALEAGVFSASLSNCTNTPVSSGSAIIVSVPYKVQIVYIYSGNSIIGHYVRYGQKIQSISGYGSWTKISIDPVILWTGSGVQNATTLTLQESISGFKYYEIIFDVENNTNAVKSTGKIPIDKPALMDGLNSKALLMKRNTDAPSGSSIKLNSGHYFSSPNTSGTVYSSACCPLKILGYR